jgi:hypothetical protein
MGTWGVGLYSTNAAAAASASATNRIWRDYARLWQTTTAPATS